MGLSINGLANADGSGSGDPVGPTGTPPTVKKTIGNAHLGGPNTTTSRVQKKSADYAQKEPLQLKKIVFEDLKSIATENSAIENLTVRKKETEEKEKRAFMDAQQHAAEEEAHGDGAKLDKFDDRIITSYNNTIKNLDAAKKSHEEILNQAIEDLIGDINDEMERLSRPSIFGHDLLNPYDVEAVGGRLKSFFKETPEVFFALRVLQRVRVPKELNVLSGAMTRGQLNTAQNEEKKAFIADTVNFVTNPRPSDVSDLNNRLRDLLASKSLGKQKEPPLHPDLFASVVIQSAQAMHLSKDDLAILISDVKKYANKDQASSLDKELAKLQ